MYQKKIYYFNNSFYEQVMPYFFIIISLVLIFYNNYRWLKRVINYTPLVFMFNQKSVTDARKASRKNFLRHVLYVTKITIVLSINQYIILHIIAYYFRNYRLLPFILMYLSMALFGFIIAKLTENYFEHYFTYVFNIYPNNEGQFAKGALACLLQQIVFIFIIVFWRINEN